MMVLVWITLTILANTIYSTKNKESVLLDWQLSEQSLPYPSCGAFVTYDEVDNIVYGIGGTHCVDCGYRYDLSNNIMSSFVIDASKYKNEFSNGNPNNAALIYIDNTAYIFALDTYGTLWKYNTITNDILIISSTLTNVLHAPHTAPCLVSNYPNNTYLYACNGAHQQKITVCYRYSVDDNSWTKINAVPAKYIRPICAFYNNIMYIFGGSNHLAYKLDTNNMILDESDQNTSYSDDDIKWSIMLEISQFGELGSGSAVVITPNALLFDSVNATKINNTFNYATIVSIGNEKRNNMNNVISIDIKNNNNQTGRPIGKKQSNLPKKYSHGTAIYIKNLQQIYYFGGKVGACQTSIYYTYYAFANQSQWLDEKLKNPINYSLNSNDCKVNNGNNNQIDHKTQNINNKISNDNNNTNNNKYNNFSGTVVLCCVIGMLISWCLLLIMCINNNQKIDSIPWDTAVTSYNYDDDDEREGFANDYRYWTTKRLNKWLVKHLENSYFDTIVIKQFIKEWNNIDLTGMILHKWFKTFQTQTTNETTQANFQLFLKHKLQSKISFKPKSLVWDVTVQQIALLCQQTEQSK